MIEPHSCDLASLLRLIFSSGAYPVVIIEGMEHTDSGAERHRVFFVEICSAIRWKHGDAMGWKFCVREIASMS